MSTKSELFSVEGVIIISSNKLCPENILLNILNVENLPSSTSHDNICKYEWKVDTKYYSATVHLYCVQDKADFDPAFCSTIRATVFYFDGKEPSDFENVLRWMPSLKDINSEVQLLVCDCCKDEGSHRKNILNWCVENEFELIELNPAEESDEEEESAFSKAKGYSRIVEALQSHPWSNLVMKDSSLLCNLPKEGNQEAEKSNADTTKSTPLKEPADNSKKMKVDDEELLLEEQWLQNVLQQDDPDGESFEALFSKFASMKEKASGLTGEERKKYAEKVAVAFWKAMGGDEDEIEGLDDD